MILVPKNWHTFQHYNKRNPPWIKLHRSMLDDYDFANLPVESRALAPMLWLLASEQKDGCFQGASEVLAFRLHCSIQEVEVGLKPLMEHGFILDASAVLAGCLQHATPEAEAEAETETEIASMEGSNQGIGTEEEIPFVVGDR